MLQRRGATQEKLPCQAERSRTSQTFVKASNTSASFLLVSFFPPILGCHTTMDRSVQELFINFTIVLITVLLMWLLVKTYQG
ncbi:hypothetical protein CgunFtcFv8_010503 [Champsocephalus gunnari]|uniref:Sarcolipin n=1 Tax=Champsocephalus gunnari TaxID=52237 RepID=A0AAN8DVD0_CHAGU|nr:hypothetical protein CgunFtcFv8_010503 [Champsocephalus gunnari]